MPQREVLSHPSFGHIPARRVLDCVFALSPEGNILHHHIEEVSQSTLDNDGVLYALNGHPPTPGRERCRIIPPFVREFNAA